MIEKSPWGAETEGRLSRLRKEVASPSLAVLCSDIHLCEKPPVARSVEPDWMGRQAWYLKQLKDLGDNLGVPIVCAGDLFDKWNPSPTLINFALAHLPAMYAVPGQHDLKNHRLEGIRDTAYWTLCEAKRLRNLDYDSPRRSGRLVMYGFPWGTKLKPRTSREEDRPDNVYLAVVHAYCWRGDYGFAGYKYMDQDHHARSFFKRLQGFHAIVSGDNHKGHLTRNGNRSLLVPGTFMRRRIDERDYSPKVGILFENGMIQRIPLEVSEDQFIEGEVDTLSEYRGGFVQELLELGDAAMDYLEALRKTLPEKRPLVRQAILEALEGL